MMKLNSHGAGRAKIHIVKIYCMVLERGREGERLKRKGIYVYI